jgi:hypothetical protein
MELWKIFLAEGILIQENMGPEGLGRKNFKIWTQSEGRPKMLHADIGTLQDLIKRSQNLK